MRVSRPSTLVAAALGALWGAVAYTILWGKTSIVVTVRYVDSSLGLITLLPVRIVIHGIRLAEAHIAGRSFSLSRNHEWIGVVSAAVGAALCVAALLALQLAVRVLTRRRSAAGSAGWT